MPGPLTELTPPLSPDLVTPVDSPQAQEAEALPAQSLQDPGLPTDGTDDLLPPLDPTLPELAPIDLAELNTAAAISQLTPLPSATPSLATLWLERARPDGTRENTPVNTGQVYNPGDRVWIHCTPDRPSHAYLFLRSGRGIIQMLYPGVGGSRNYLPPGRRVSLPHAESPLVFDSNPGSEELVLVLAASPVAEFDTISANSVRAVQQQAGVYLLTADEVNALDRTLTGWREARTSDTSAPALSSANSGHPATAVLAPDNTASPVVVRFSLSHGP